MLTSAASNVPVLTFSPCEVDTRATCTRLASLAVVATAGDLTPHS